jgi:hypothetical protein
MNTMKFTLATFALIWALTGFQNVSAQDTLYWSSVYKLTPKDFHGKPDTTASYPSHAVCGIKYTGHAKKATVQTEVVGIFIRPKSWVVISDDDSLWLVHEQVNFDIAELFARKLRKTFSEYKYRPTTVHEDLDSLYDVNHAQMNEMYKSYEKETNHGTDPSGQSIWNAKIKSEMEILEKYSKS